MKQFYHPLKVAIASLLLAGLSVSTKLVSQTTQTFLYTGSIQQFTIPACVSSITITAIGAGGGGGNGTVGGKGASMKGTFTCVPGQVLKYLVGGKGINANTWSSSGGGGSFVTDLSNNPWIIAGGGAGTNGIPLSGTEDASIGTSGLNGNSPSSPGAIGIGGAPGQGATGSTGCAGNGGGLLTNGVLTTCCPNNGGLAFVNGGTGAAGGCGQPTTGGFGGGGGGGNWGGGGGGGYSGGGCNYHYPGNGGGAGSFNGGTGQVNTAGVAVGDGTIIMTYFPGLQMTYTVAPAIGICNGGTATLTAVAGMSTYTWSSGGNAPTTTVNPTSTTNYTVEGLNPQGCPTKAVITVTVDQALPSLTVVNTASSSAGICPTKSVNLTASGATTYTWSGGSPTVTNGVTFNPTASYTYVVTGANGCGTNTAVTSVSIHPFPTVFPVASSPTLCSGNTLTLTAAGNATNYTWSGGNAPSGNGVGFIPPVSTVNYSVVGTSVLSCTALATIPVTVYATPVLAPAASPQLICIGGSSTLSAQGAISYTWSSLTQTVFTSTFVVTPSSPGISTYTITKANSTCSDTKQISVVTNSLPTVFALASPNLVCALQPATISIAGGQSYTWTAPGTPTYNFNGASVIVYPPTSMLYTVAASDGTCKAVTTLSLSVDPNPTISVSASSPSVCIGQSVTLTASGGNSYTWTTPSGTLSGSSIIHGPTTATAYTLTGDNSFSCTATMNQVVLVYPSPTISINLSKPIVCSGAPVTLTASGANSYTWGANANNVLTPIALVNPTATITGPVTYSVTGSFTTGCPSTTVTTVSVYVPTISVTGNTNTCYGGQLSLTAGGGVLSNVTWTTATGTVGGNPLTTTVTSAGVFTVAASGTSSSVTCPVTHTIAYGINANPTVAAVAQRTTICKGEFVEIHAGGAVSYTWQNPGSGSVNGATLTVSPQNPTNNYTVGGTDANGCMGTGTVQLKVSTCNGINGESLAADGLIIYPNPNTGEFMVRSGAKMDLVLINELGQVIRAFVLSEANNYTISVNDLANGIYFISGKNDAAPINRKIVVEK